MKIGIDFDNTIANYDEVFFSVFDSFGFELPVSITRKEDLKDWLKKTQNQSDLIWQKIQGKVYGKFMNQAKLNNGVANFFLRAKKNSASIYIVSHKTLYGHFDEEKVNLRTEAMKWLEKKNFFDQRFLSISENNVFFLKSREDKVKKINELGLDYFIDDLSEVYDEPLFPKNTYKILYNKKNPDNVNIDYKTDSWNKISNKIFGPLSYKEVKFIIEHSGFKKNINNLKADIKGGGNSKLYSFEIGPKAYVAKFYPEDNLNNRVISEFNACQFLEKNNIRNVSKIYASIDNLNINIFHKINGTNIQSIGTSEIEQALSFCKTLHRARENLSAKNLSEAKEACLSPNKIWEQIFSRKSKYIQHEMTYSVLGKFLKNTVDPLIYEVINNRQNNFEDINPYEICPKFQQTISPSDFGFHNALLVNGKIHWIDFEYFGWDDPTKLLCDFFWHPGNNLSEVQKKLWLEEGIKIYSVNRNNLRRLIEYCLPIYGLRWIMIILGQINKSFMNDEKSDFDLQVIKDKVDLNLRNAKNLCNEIQFLCQKT